MGFSFHAAAAVADLVNMGLKRGQFSSLVVGMVCPNLLVSPEVARVSVIFASS